MKFKLLIIILFFITDIYGQYDVFNLLKFNNEFERDSFEALKEDSAGYLSLLMVASGRVDSSKYEEYSKDLKDIFAQLDSAKLVRKSASKQIKTVFETVHNSLLKKYEYQNQFVEIFETGYYNCVSATAVYSYMLQGMGIEHGIIETPTHVYAVAFVDGKDFVLESTDPVQGYYEVTDKDRERELDMLVAQKIITEEQRNSDQLDSILDVLYPSMAINTARLTSIQYHNQAIYSFEEGDYKASVDNAIKAFFISADTLNRSTMKDALITYLDAYDTTDVDYYNYLNFYISLDSSAQHYEMIEAVFLNKAYQHLVEKDQLSLYYKFYKALRNKDTTDAWTNRVDALHYSYIGEYYYHKSAWLNAYQNCLHSLFMDTTIQGAQQFFVASFASLMLESHFEEKLDTVLALREALPVLTNVANWNGLYGEVLLEEMYSQIALNNMQTVSTYRKYFEELMDNESLKKKLSLSMVGSVYARLTLKDYNKSKNIARATLNKGLLYAPKSPELIRMKQFLNL